MESYDRSYVVTQQGTLERMVGKRIMGTALSEDDDKRTLKVIFPKASAESIARHAQFRGKYIQTEPFNSMHLRDHVEANAKSYRSESTHTGSQKSFSLRTLV
jgi:hypothetical protein